MSKSRIKSLEKQINYHRKAYYNKDAQISDVSFDLLIDELAGLDPDNNAITSVGAPVEESSEWKKATHKIPMGSLNKASNIEQMDEWLDKYVKKETEVFVIDKIDGLSIELLYEDGKLVGAISRGDGKIGDNIYSNVIKMGGVLLTLPLLFTGSLRGEIIITKANHKKYFSNQANVRNGAAGISRRLDGKDCEKLNILFYQALGNVDVDTEAQMMQYLSKNLNLPTPSWSLSKAGSDTKKFVQSAYILYQEKLRDKLDYEIDGLVVKVNNLSEQADHGESNSRPKGAVALKFPVEKAATTIQNITIQLGNSGRLTPVAEFSPVSLAGAEITRASLHNFKRVQDLEIDIGAVVSISRRGEIIPQIEVVLKSTGTIFATPKKCPVCSGKVEFQGEYLMCSSVNTCPGQIKGRIATWINTIGILEWGDSLIDKLVDTGLVLEIPDLYKLSVKDLAALDRMGEKSAQKAYDILWSHDKLPLDIFLGGLNIQNCAASTIKMLMESGYDTLNKILDITEEMLSFINGIGPVKAESILNGLKNNEEIIGRIIEAGIDIKEPVKGKLTGVKICVTGKTEIKRNDLKKMIENCGGIFKSSVTSDCNYLCMADSDSMTAKAVNARAIGIKIISETKLLEMVK